MNKKRMIRDKPEGFDSWEELYCTWYLEELKKAGFIDTYMYHPRSFDLCSGKSYTTLKPLTKKFKEEVHTILQSHNYTPDFAINWNEKALGVFIKIQGLNVNYRHKDCFFWANAETGFPYSLIDVKGMFNANNTNREFAINQKWLFDRYKIYCQKVLIPEHLFQKTFTPARYLSTDKTMKPRKLKYEPRSLSDYLRTLNHF